jgi:hypothetical protein
MSPEEKNTFLNTSPEAIPTLNFELWSLQFDLMDFPQKLHHRLLNLLNCRVA